MIADKNLLQNLKAEQLTQNGFQQAVDHLKISK